MEHEMCDLPIIIIDTAIVTKGLKKNLEAVLTYLLHGAKSFSRS